MKGAVTTGLGTMSPSVRRTDCSHSDRQKAEWQVPGASKREKRELTLTPERISVWEDEVLETDGGDGRPAVYCPSC